MNTPAPRFTVTVCYATAQREILRTLEVEQGATIAMAITASGVLDEMATLAAAEELGALADPRDPGHAGFDPAVHLAGIFGKKKPLDTLLRPGDRVELYRPLLADPKESRRRRAGGKQPA